MSATNPLGVPAHQHPNGGGWVADTAHVAESVYVGPAARIYGGAIYGGTIRGGAIRGSTIRGGAIWGGTIEGGTIEHSRHVLTIGPIGSENQHATLVHTDDGHLLSIGCWQDGTVDQLAAEVQRRCPDRADEYAEIEAILRRRIAEWDAEREAAS